LDEFDLLPCHARVSFSWTRAQNGGEIDHGSSDYRGGGRLQRRVSESLAVEHQGINLLLGGAALANYNPITGAGVLTSGGLPIQTPVSPNGKYLITAATLTGTITIIDTATDELVKVLPCSAGCHGVNFGAKRGGGYYAYVASKFSNDLIVLDPDPNDDGNPADATIVGRVLLTLGEDSAAKTDDRVTAYAGMGGQGVLPIPLVYNGWVQKLPASWKKQLTQKQLNPIP
jgi:DNA-binding beta-propeller fold protein YncE